MLLMDSWSVKFVDTSVYQAEHLEVPCTLRRVSRATSLCYKKNRQTFGKVGSSANADSVLVTIFGIWFSGSGRKVYYFMLLRKQCHKVLFLYSQPRLSLFSAAPS